MKKICLLFLFAALCLTAVSAGAAPAATDGTVSAWIDGNGFLEWEPDEETVLQVPIPMEEILAVQEGQVLCLTRDQRVLSVQRTGYQTLLNVDPATLGDAGIRLEDGKLRYEGTEISASTGCAVTDGCYLYYTETTDGVCRLMVRSVRESEIQAAAGSRDALAMALSGRVVPEPLSMTVTREALTLTGAEHQVVVMNLVTGVVTEYPQETGGNTIAACLARETLYRYTQSADGKWVPESARPLNPVIPLPTAAPTFAPTPAPTPRPTPAPTRAPEDDGTIYFGAYGKTVRKIQQRLADLGYPTGNVDGRYGDQTQLAINLFCDAIHVREHNYITEKVQRRLFAAGAPVYDPYLPLKKGDRGVSVLYMQIRLKELGYDPIKLDGIYGKLTIAAVALFQKDYQILLADKEIPGEVASHEMLEKLFAPEPTPTPSPEPTPTPTPAPTPTPEPATKTDL